MTAARKGRSRDEEQENAAERMIDREKGKDQESG